MFSWLQNTGAYFNQIVSWAWGASSWVYDVLSNPIYLVITLVILVLILVPWTDH